MQLAGLGRQSGLLELRLPGMSGSDAQLELREFSPSHDHGVKALLSSLQSR